MDGDMKQHLIEIKDNEKLICSCVLYFVPLRSRNLAVIEEIKTTEGYRNKGFATHIVGLAVTKAKSLGADTVELCYNSKDVLAEKLYSKCGFVADGNIRAKYVINKVEIGRW